MGCTSGQGHGLARAGRCGGIPTGWSVVFLAFLLFAPFSQAATTQPAQPGRSGLTEDPVAQALSRAKAYLYTQQHDGNWEHVPSAVDIQRDTVEGGQWGGLTALATYALLTSRESPLDERVQQAVSFLLSADLRGIYALGMRCQVWSLLPPDAAVRIAAGRDASALQHALKTLGEARGLYGYLASTSDPWYDHSASQFGVMGMWACGHVGVSIPSRYWQDVEDGFRRHQYEQGGWSYVWRDDGQDRPGDSNWGPRFAMTSAGVASLLMSREFLHATDGLDCSGNIRDPQIELGTRWLSDHAADALVPSEASHTRLTNDGLWGLARVAMSDGRRCFGGFDWYERGVADLLAGQTRDGSWGNVTDTAFALLFLAQGRAPVAIEKLEYGITPRDAAPKAGNWDQRPLDVSNVTQWIALHLHRPLNWRIVRLGQEDGDEFDALGSGPGEAPVLYLSGNQPLEFTNLELERLRRYAREGGLILGHADGSSTMFGDSFRALGERLFPGYTFRDLPPDHPIYTRGPFAASGWTERPTVESLGNGCRELMVLLPRGDPARQWQTLWVAPGMGRLEGVRAQEAAELAADIVAYAADPSALPDRVLSRPAPHAHITPDYSLAVARLRYDGNWNPEPAGWPRLAATLLEQQQVDLSVETVELGEGKLPGYKIAHLTGTAHFRLSESAREELRKFIADGGTLILEAAGGSPDFTSSAEAEIQAIFGDRASPTLLGISHRVYSTGHRIAAVDYRPAARRLFGDLRTPRLRGFDIAGRTAIFLSPEDLSVGLTGAATDGIIGYDPASATAIMSNVLLYAADK